MIRKKGHAELRKGGPATTKHDTYTPPEEKKKSIQKLKSREERPFEVKSNELKVKKRKRNVILEGSKRRKKKTIF